MSNSRLYDLLAGLGDPARADMQREILRHLSNVQTSTPTSEHDKAGVDALRRLHFEQLLRLQHRETCESEPRVSKRRLQWRAECRAHWQHDESDDVATITLQDIEQRSPTLFSDVIPVAPTQPTVAAHAARDAAHSHSHAADDSFEAAVQALAQRRVASAPPPSSSYTRFEPPPHASRMSPPPPALSDLLRKRTDRTSDDDDDEAQPAYSAMRALPPPQAQRNPFQTAGERLQFDRATGRARDDRYNNDDDDNGSSMRRRGSGNGRAPGPGNYHPINQNLLFGGSGDNSDIPCTAGVTKPFVLPTGGGGDDKKKPRGVSSNGNGNGNGGSKQALPTAEPDDDIDPRLRSCDPELVSKIEMEIVDNGDPITFDDIAGLRFAKKCVNELVIWPMARPDIFTGLRALPKGLLLFGPPGTGKTLIGKAIANQSGATFFSISASSLTSKWIGEGEKLVRTLFAVAAVKQPSVIFIDEIDSLLTQRSSEENEASRRMKTEFLVQLDGAGTKATDVILVVGATNRPQELDEAARRRFVKRLYIPLPSLEARLDMINRLLRNNRHDLTDTNKQFVAEATKGYSGADVRALCTEAAMGPIRTCDDIRTMDANAVRPISLEDFTAALRGVRSSVAVKDLEFYREWNDEFGSFPFESHEG